MFNLSDDDSFSTQLEGKKLKNRGARMEGDSFVADPQLEIGEDGPALMEQGEIEEGQEYFTDRDLGKEDKVEREQRLKRELAAARKQQLELQKQQTQQQKIEQGVDDPNLKLDKVEQGVLQSQNKGQATDKQEAKQQKESEQEKPREAPLRKTDGAAVSALLGPDNIKNLNLSDDIKLAEKAKGNSVPAKQVADVRGKDGGGLQI